MLSLEATCPPARYPPLSPTHPNTSLFFFQLLLAPLHLLY